MAPTCQIFSVVAFSAVCFLPHTGGDSLLYGPDCHVLMKCLLSVAVPGHIQLNHNALVYAYTNNGPATVLMHQEVLPNSLVCSYHLDYSYLSFIYLLLGKLPHCTEKLSTLFVLIGEKFEIYRTVSADVNFEPKLSTHTGLMATAFSGRALSALY